MEKMLLAMLLLAVGVSSALAQNVAKPNNSQQCMTVADAAKIAKADAVADDDGWDFFQLGVWFDTPSSTADSNVYGIKVGAPFCSGTGTVSGVETAVFCGATDNINGLQACILASVSKHVDGMQFSIVNYVEEVNGLQLGVVNVAKEKGLQVGIVNYIEGGVIPVMIIANWKF